MGIKKKLQPSSSNIEVHRSGDPEFTLKEANDDAYDVGSHREVNGAAVVGGIVGLLVGGPIVGVAAAAGTAYMAATKKGDVGNFARKSGTAIADMGDKIQQVEHENHIVDKTTKQMVKGASWVEKKFSKNKRKSSRDTQADLVS